MIRDKQSKIEPNHARDVFHAVVPSVYCNYVLLDKYWDEQIKTACARLTRTIALAKVFSLRADGIERFLKALEG